MEEFSHRFRERKKCIAVESEREEFSSARRAFPLSRFGLSPFIHNSAGFACAFQSFSYLHTSRLFANQKCESQKDLSTRSLVNISFILSHFLHIVSKVFSHCRVRSVKFSHETLLLAGKLSWNEVISFLYRRLRAEFLI